MYNNRLNDVGSKHEASQGVQCGDVAILYKMIWQDVRGAVDFIHEVRSCFVVAPCARMLPQRDVGHPPKSQT